MAYTVKQLAQISLVTVRTLHFYDEIGLLPPARVGKNGYRYYEEEQLLRLQQILFFRELGFDLKQILAMVTNPQFDTVTALLSHREALVAKQARARELLSTVDKTIQRLQGGITMADKELYEGFSEEQQNEYESYLVNRYGDDAKKRIAEARQKNLSKDQMAVLFKEWDLILGELKELCAQTSSADSEAVQALVARHYRLICNFWRPTRATYIGLANEYLDLAWKKAFAPFDDQHPRIALFLAAAIEFYADRHLE